MKKVLALTLAMLLCASMLAGCGKSEEEQQIEQQTTEQESADNTNGIGMTSEDCKGKVLAWNVGVDSASSLLTYSTGSLEDTTYLEPQISTLTLFCAAMQTILSILP